MTLPPLEGHVVREATVRDADELARLRWQFRTEAGTQRSITVESFVDEMVSFVREALGGRQWNAFVAERGGRLIGCVWVQFVERSRSTGVAGFGEDAPLALPLEGD
jgi:hypothetical protein